MRRLVSLTVLSKRATLAAFAAVLTFSVLPAAPVSAAGGRAPGMEVQTDAPVLLAQTDFKEIMRGVQREEEWRARGGPRYEDRRRDDRRWERERDDRRWQRERSLRERDRRWERDDRRYGRSQWERRGPPPAYRGLSPRQAACAQRYRTYDPRSNTYVVRPGVRAVCRG